MKKSTKSQRKPDLFRSLKLKFILTTTLSSALVLLAAFTIIYNIVAHDMNNRPPLRPQPQNLQTGNFEEPENEFNDDFDDDFEERLHEDRGKSLKVLLASLAITGAVIEFMVILVSLYLSEQSIKPVREAYEAQKTFVANASHEIKTPLAVIQANLEAADIKNNHWLDNVAEKTEELVAINNQLLALARLESLPENTTTEQVNLEKVVKDTADFYVPKIAEKGIKLSIKSTAKKSRDLNRQELVQILNILLDNAVKYADQKISLIISDHEIAIKNDGATIAKNDLKHVFDRFYQTDKTKSGVGLGLAIAKQIAAHNKWQLRADSDQTSTTFTLSI